MRHSEFWALMDQEFGSGYAPTVASGHVIHALGDRTVNEALAAGVNPRRVWEALCVDFRIEQTFLDQRRQSR